MAQCWYRTSDWTDEDEKRLAGRLKRYKTPYDRIQTLRIKALALMKSGDPTMYPVSERLLNLAINDPELKNLEIDRATSDEINMCHGMLGEFAEYGHDRNKAEFHYRKQVELATIKDGTISSSVLNTGMRLAILLSKADDHTKLIEADRFLDQLKDSELTSHLSFVRTKLWYCVAKARIYLKLDRLEEAKDFARAAIQLDGADGIDQFKSKPMDNPLMDECMRREMQAIINHQA